MQLYVQLPFLQFPSPVISDNSDSHLSATDEPDSLLGEMDTEEAIMQRMDKLEFTSVEYNYLFNMLLINMPTVSLFFRIIICLSTMPESNLALS